jgi:putative transposase
MTHLRHYDNLNTARFITFSCYQRIRYLLRQTNMEALADAIRLMQSQEHVRLLGYVFMPDHVHLVVLPPSQYEMGRAIGRIKSRSARSMTPPPGHQQVYRPDGTRGVWQYRGYDHNCRTPETVLEKINYCHMNPVKQGLVDSPEMWEWSSHNWYKGRRDVPLDMDITEL